MAIDDPTAIPESADAADEYMKEAGTAFDSSHHDRAMSLYFAAVQSSMLSDDEVSLASYRLAVMHLAAGDRNEAYRWAFGNTQPGAAELLAAIDGATHDAPVDPSETPQTVEDIVRYIEAANDAHDRGDTTTEEALRRAAANSPAGTPRTVAAESLLIARLAHADGRDDEARTWAHAALAHADKGDDHDGAVALLREMGVDVQDDNPIETAGSRRLIAGIEAWQNGDQAAARTEFEAVLAATDVTTGDQGRAAFYLGSMAYYAHDYDTARTHLHRARDDADDPEKTWATEMLEWRWQEEGS